MLIKKYPELLEALNEINSENYTSTFVLGIEAYPIKKILVQTVVRTINKEDIQFLAIKDIELYEDSKGKGIFKNLISIFESKDFPFMVDDIVNQRLGEFLLKRGYLNYVYEKNGNKVNSRYIVKK